REEIMGLRVLEEIVGKVRVSRMDRNVKRGEPLFEDALKVSLRKIGESQIVTKQERKSKVLVFDSESAANLLSSRELMHKAEDTIILANSGLDALQFNSKIFLFVFFDIDFPEFTRRLGYFQ